MGGEISSNNREDKDEFYVKKEEAEKYIKKIETNLTKVSSTVKEVSENLLCSMICCCCTVCALTDDQNTLKKNSFLMKRVELHLEELRQILDNQKLFVNQEIYNKKELEYNETVTAYASLTLVQVVVEE